MIDAGLLAAKWRCCTLQTDDNWSRGERLDQKMSRCQTDMEQLRRELDHAHRCVNDLEVNLMVASSAPEADQEPMSNGPLSVPPSSSSSLSLPFSAFFPGARLVNQRPPTNTAPFV